MAGKSSKSGKKTKGKKRSYTTKKQKQRKEKMSLIKDEIILIITFVLSILLILSNFDLSGKVGEFINQVTFGLVGLIGYLMPIILFYIVVFVLANKGNKVAYVKAISFIVLVASVAALIQLILTNKPLETISTYYKLSSNSKRGGGIVGGAIVNLIHPLFGTVGSYVIIIGIMLICFLFLTGKALFVTFSKKGRNSIEEYRQAKLNENKTASKAKDKTQEKNTPRTFLLKDKFKNFAFKNNEKGKTSKTEEKITDKKDQDVESRVNKVMDKDNDDNSGPANENQGSQAFSMEEIGVGSRQADSDLDIPIYRSEFSYNDNDIDNEEAINEDTDDLNLSSDMALDDNKSSHTTGDKQANKQKLSSSSGEIEELQLDQTIDEKKKYILPPVKLLSVPKRNTKLVPDKVLKETAVKLQDTLESFGVGVTITNVSCGPTVTRYELQPEQGVKVSKITSLADDIKLNLAASDIRIEAPIPGKAAVGIEVPNKNNQIVTLREMIESKEFKDNPSKLAFTVGKDIGGRNIIADIAKMPHLLIAGATGSGKSVCINSIIMSILYNAKPSEVRLIMIDPKVVELSAYNGIPHLLLPVVTDPKKAASALNWGVNEMTDRYKKFADLGVKDLEGYNNKVKNDPTVDEEYKRLSQIVIIVDELADLMMVSSKEVEDSIARLAQMARAAGIHLIIATQRPSVNVITGVIKANIPSRIAFAVSSAVDSRTILDGSGAEKLLGKGDMLYYPSGLSKPLRVQGAFVTEKEINRVVEFLMDKNGQATYDKEVEKEIVSTQSQMPSAVPDYMERDEYFSEAGRYIIENEKASIGMLQRVFRIGFNRAARIMDQLHQAGAVGGEDGTKPRTILMTTEEFEKYLKENDIV